MHLAATVHLVIPAALIILEVQVRQAHQAQILETQELQAEWMSHFIRDRR